MTTGGILHRRIRVYIFGKKEKKAPLAPFKTFLYAVILLSLFLSAIADGRFFLGSAFLGNTQWIWYLYHC